MQHRVLLIDAALRSRLPQVSLPGTEVLSKALYYAVFPGGKRLRPLLVLLAAEVCGSPPEPALPAACAVEFLHAASLILDDLPAMDDALLRRGRPALHIEFGADIALLAALALLNEAYAIFASLPSLLPIAVREIGLGGMIGGQAADLCGSHEPSRIRKTTALTRLTMAAGAAAAGADAESSQTLICFGEQLGEAYQICDDIVDARASDDESGKNGGQDRRHNRCSVLTQLGSAAACERVRVLMDNGIERLRRQFGSGPECRLLEGFARALLARALELGEHDSAFAAAGLSGSRGMERDLLARSSSGSD